MRAGGVFWQPCEAMLMVVGNAEFPESRAGSGMLGNGGITALSLPEPQKGISGVLWRIENGRHLASSIPLRVRPGRFVRYGWASWRQVALVIGAAARKAARQAHGKLCQVLGRLKIQGYSVGPMSAPWECASPVSHEAGR